MIPHKFRGKSIYGGTWVYGDLVRDKKNSSIRYLVNNRKIEYVEITILPETVGIYSTLNCVEGREIFSGDIVSFNRDYNYVVKFDKGAFYLYHTKQKTFDGEPYCWGLLSRAFDADLKTLGDLKIVGNEFDNPELMKDY